MPQQEFPLEVDVPSKQQVIQKAMDAIADPLIAKIKGTVHRGLGWNEEAGRLTGDVMVELEQSDIDQMMDDPHTEETFLVNMSEEVADKFNNTVNDVIEKLKSAVESLDT